MREKAEILGPVAFVYGDHELVHAHLGMDALKPKSKPAKDTPQSGFRVNKSRPRGICWKFNENRGCKKDPCQWKHECRECAGDHSVLDSKIKK